MPPRRASASLIGPIEGITREQQRELAGMLARLSALWSQLTAAAARGDQAAVETVRREIATCRERVEAIKRSGTAGSA